jgi:translation initiation factor 1A
MAEYGDFHEIQEPVKENKDKKVEESPQQIIPTRVRLPREKQLIGMVLQRLGGKRMSVKTTDNKVRNCRVPGRFGRRFWLREGNFVMIEPWPDDDEKGDIVYQYSSGETFQLKKRHLVDNLVNKF